MPLLNLLNYTVFSEKPQISCILLYFSLVVKLVKILERPRQRPCQGLPEPVCRLVKFLFLLVSLKISEEIDAYCNSMMKKYSIFMSFIQLCSFLWVVFTDT